MYELGRSLLHHPTLGLPARGDHLIRLTKKITSNHLNISKFSKVEISLLLQTFDCQLHHQNLSKVGRLSFYDDNDVNDDDDDDDAVMINYYEQLGHLLA